MQGLLDIPAPAKVNLFLHVTGRRADGYHTLQSAFMLIDWADRLHIECRRDGRLTRQDSGVPADSPLPAEDLCLRAARALQQASGTSLGAHIVLEKHLPMQAGLGGGSSDAASTLLALNRLWRLHWPRERLIAIGERLGADIPFFLGGRNAWVEGIGERLTPLSLPAARVAVVKPPAGLATAAIFQAPELPRDTRPAIMEVFLAFLRTGDWSWGRNDLQSVAERLCPMVRQCIDQLAAVGIAARMTGSGSAVFAVLTSASQVQAFNQIVWPSGWQARVCNGMPQHPLCGW